MAVERTLTVEDVTREIGAVTSASDARAVVNRASRIAGVAGGRPLRIEELLRVCQALAAEGGLVQEMAETIAVRALKR